MYDGMMAESVRIAGHSGHDVAAYFARPLGPGPYPAVVVIHHMPGWDDATKEITRRFAIRGYAAICPHLHYREGLEASPDDAAAASRAAGGVPDERFLGDAAAAIHHLRSLTYSNGKVGMIGYCSGGRQTFLAACSLDLDAAVDCYGGFVAASPPEGFPLRMNPVINKAGRLNCPLLGLVGAEDKNPSPAETKSIAQVLKGHGKTYTFHTYQGAGHGFVATDRVSYRPEAAKEGWERIWEWYGRHLAA